MRKYLIAVAVLVAAASTLAFSAEPEPAPPLEWACHNTWIGHACTSRGAPPCGGWTSDTSHTGQGTMQNHDNEQEPCEEE